MIGNPLEYALKKLSLRQYSRCEIRELLQRKGYNEEEINQVMEKLTAWGYLDDKKMAESLLTQLTMQKAYGRYYVKRKLAARGIEPEFIEEILALYDEEREFELAAAIVDKLPIDSSTFNHAALYRKLQRKGFSPTVIRRISEYINVATDGLRPMHGSKLQ